MSSRKSSRRQQPPLCGSVHSDDGVDPAEFFGRSSGGASSHRGNRGRRKTLQLCAEVARTLNAVLTGGCGDGVLSDLRVLSVEPAPGGGNCLLVTLELEGPSDAVRIGVALARLGLARGLLRSEVAASVSRKRVPELTFRVLAAGEARP